MVAERKKIGKLLFNVVDVIVILFSYALAYILREYYFPTQLFYSSEYITLLMIIIPVWLILLRSVNLHEVPRTRSYAYVFLQALKVVAIGSGVIIFFIFVLRLNLISRVVLMLFAGINLVLLYSSKIFLFTVSKYYRSKGFNKRNVFVMADDSSEEFIDKLLGHPEWGYRILMILSDSPHIKEKYGRRVKVITAKASVKSIIEFDVVDEVIYCMNEINQKEIQSLIYACEEIGVSFRMQSHLWNVTGTKSKLTYFDEIPFFTFQNTPTDYMALQLKWMLDYVFAFLTLLLFAPVMLVVIIMIKSSSSGPTFFKQMRVGLRGRKFYLYKFRTMVQNAEEMKDQLEEMNEVDGPVFKIKDDPRITKIGKFLRKTGLDELPQFYNVLRGDMSIVGPRPPIPEEVSKYERWQLRRLSMKPGLTCIWQIMPNRNNIPFNQWMKLDLQYIDTWSPKLDLMLFLKTIKTVLTAEGV
jgi:exopolysaccharide biosynthesis polyprenyl glycosylphosphotransferase